LEGFFAVRLAAAFFAGVVVPPANTNPFSARANRACGPFFWISRRIAE
jgi:hypothetical protein